MKIEEAPLGEPNDEINQLQTSSSVAGRTFRCRSKVGRSQKTDTPDTPSVVLINYILVKNSPRKVTQQLDNIDTFLAGMVSTMKKFTLTNNTLPKDEFFMSSTNWSLKNSSLNTQLLPTSRLSTPTIHPSQFLIQQVFKI